MKDGLRWMLKSLSSLVKGCARISPFGEKKTKLKENSKGNVNKNIETAIISTFIRIDFELFDILHFDSEHITIRD